MFGIWWYLGCDLFCRFVVVVVVVTGVFNVPMMVMYTLLLYLRAVLDLDLRLMSEWRMKKMVYNVFVVCVDLWVMAYEFII